MDKYLEELGRMIAETDRILKSREAELARYEARQVSYCRS